MGSPGAGEGASWQAEGEGRADHAGRSAALRPARFAQIPVGVVAGTVAVALLIVWLSNASASHTLPRAFYFAGAFLGAVAVLGGWGTYDPCYRNPRQREIAVSKSFVYGTLALLLLGTGVALEILL